jgi:hypothetical protein
MAFSIKTTQPNNTPHGNIQQNDTHTITTLNIMMELSTKKTQRNDIQQNDI